MPDKVLFTLNVDSYAPEICELTYPLLRRYADKIGAEFRVINERRWPELPPVYEKLQIFELGRGYEWIIYLDSDALIHPDTMDITEVVGKDTVVHNGVDYAANRYTYDEYFRRDGRHIASCNWFTVASSWCLDLWKPLDDLSFKEAVERIKPTALESRAGIVRAHLIDDFVLSRNIAKYGLRCKTFREILRPIGQVDASFLWHEYLLTQQQKLQMIRQVLKLWTGGAFE